MFECSPLQFAGVTIFSSEFQHSAEELTFRMFTNLIAILVVHILFIACISKMNEAK